MGGLELLCKDVPSIPDLVFVLLEGTTRREMNLNDSCWNMKMLKRG